MASQDLKTFLQRKRFRLDAAELPASTGAEPAQIDLDDPKRITAAFKRSFGRPRYAGHLDKADPREIAGWVCRPPAPAEQCTVVLCLGQLPITFAGTGIRRRDLDAVERTAGLAGFQIDLSADAVRAGAIEVLSKLHRTAVSGDHTDPLAVPATLTISVLEERTDGADLKSDHVLPLPQGVADTRPLRAWLEFFDVEEFEIAIALKATETVQGLSPRPEGADGGAQFVAFYLPQFHPIEQNDEWWGNGFTEWTGVAVAKPQFPDHAAPNVPADLGFYDLRVRDVRRRQAELARQYGIYGFCYYFYWFSGQRILEKPLELMLTEGEPSLPFCLCWANEPWSRRWDGSDKEVLLAQEHDLETDLGIIDDLMPYFENERYIRIDGKPVLLIYRSLLMPDRAEFAQRLKAEARRRGLPGLHLCNVMSFGDGNATGAGFDAAVEFPPHNVLAKEIEPNKVEASAGFEGKIYDHEDLVRQIMAQPRFNFPYYPGVMPRWDNTARKGANGHIFHGAAPDLFEVWLRHAAERTLETNRTAPLAFINSWNEWGEGAHLEPDRRFGRRYLEAVRRVAAGELRRATAEALAGIEQADGAPSERDLAIASLVRENELMAQQLAAAGMLMAPPPLLPGTPPMAVKMASYEAGGAAHVDRVNNRPAGTLAIVRRDSELSIAGWLCGDRATGGASTDFGYLVLTRLQGRESFFGPITTRVSRADVVDALKLPKEGSFVGFMARFDIAGLKPGVYSVKLIDVKDKRAVQVSCSTTVKVV